MISRIRSTITSLKGRRAGISPSVDDFLMKHGNEPIVQFTISRTVLNPMLTGAVGVLSPSFRRKTQDTKLYHLQVLIKTRTSSFNLEKNERISIGNYNIRRGAENMPVMIPSGLTLNMILERTHLLMGGKFLPYSAYNNNCSDFVLAMLRANNLATSINTRFVEQMTDNLFTPELRRITNTITDIAGIADKVIQGGDIIKDDKKVNSWISFVRVYAHQNDKTVFEALRDERCKMTYREKM